MTKNILIAVLFCVLSGCGSNLAKQEKAVDAADGPFKAEFESLQQYTCPEWFRDAKFGIWAHWGPQCVPMFGDWYAKRMYVEGDKKYAYHLQNYGHPSTFGYKDIVIQRPDGSLDPEVETLLADLAAWMQINGEAIHGTRPWTVYGEGDTQTTEGHFKEDFGFSASDIRFTQSKNGKTVYAIALGWPAEGKLAVRALAEGKKAIKRVRLLGYRGTLDWKQTAQGLEVTLPDKAPCEHAIALKIN